MWLNYWPRNYIANLNTCNLLIRAVNNSTGNFSPLSNIQSEMIIASVVYWRAQRDVDRLMSKQKLR